MRRTLIIIELREVTGAVVRLVFKLIACITWLSIAHRSNAICFIRLPSIGEIAPVVTAWTMIKILIVLLLLIVPLLLLLLFLNFIFDLQNFGKLEFLPWSDVHIFILITLLIIFQKTV